MAEAYSFAGHIYGDAGVFSYRLADHNLGDHIGSLESSRRTDKEPRFSLVGASAELYPPSKSARPSASSELWRVRREQQRWLIKSHPEAAMGNFALQEPLREDMAKFKTVESLTNDGPLLAMGSMPTVSGRQNTNKPVPFLASATGQSGEFLRLTVADQTAWEWGDGNDASLQLSVIDPLHSEREISWATDGLSITQIKYAEGLSNQVNVRWLLVQKGTSTTILQPEHHPVPITETQIMDGSIAGSSAALVKANPILRLNHTETGGNAHADVVFSPAAFGQAPVLALIDECGFWSIWDLMGTYRVDLNSVRVMLRACGQINTGPLDGFPVQHKYPAERHGLVVVAKPMDTILDPLETDTRSGSAGLTAPVLLMWKADQVQAVNMHSATTISPLKRFWVPEGKHNRIVEVQNCPGMDSRVFILTEKHLVWAEIRRNQEYPTILLSIAHVGGGSSLPKMTACALDDGTAMVFTFCTKTDQLSVYWFKAREGGPVRWHRHITSLPSANDVSRPSHISQLTVTPLPLNLSNNKYPSGLGAQYKRAGVEFFQVNMLFNDLSLRYGIYTTMYTPAQEIVLPTKRLAWSMTEEQRQWKKRRDHFLQHFETTFVLPDGMTEKGLASALQRRGAGEDELVGHKEPEVKVPQPVRLNMERLCRSIGRRLADTQRAGPKGLPRDLFDAIQDLFNHSEPGSCAPLATWHQLAEAVGDDVELDDVSNGMETEIERLFDAVDENKQVPQLRRFSEKEPADALVGFAYLVNQYCNFWLDSPESRVSEDVQEQRKVWIAEVARNMLFSSYGVLVQDVPVFGPQNLEASQGSRREPASSAMLTSSPRSSQPSQLPSESNDGSDGAISRLCLLVPSLTAMELAPSKSHNLLSYWPAERGHDPESYVSTVAVASDDKFREAREKLQRKEARRRSHVDKFRRQSMMRPSMGYGHEHEVMGSSPGPTRVQVMSSQAGPSSSQTQAPSMLPLTMSQPVSGPFGARKKKPRPKRKSGFR
ncbi:hypothetical protein LLEC1_05908 [Akanthomyces lecanii]|uniref:RNA polymerase I-specific transcription initiation factor RRN6-like protein n=1 Tax=Cordyceps confragosa TaxID=2714763 RepID=A0A179I6R6_CORDF|nr:hypothetical protein LLEC1_05908 [Akanthomyces lecanii]